MDATLSSFDQNGEGFDLIRIALASPEKIRAWSRGEVKKPETINYRTFKPEKDGLFCARIFGPVKDWECSCGKYKRIKNKGVICDKCGVEVTLSKVRRERMGHIELASPVSHVWFFKGVPSRIGHLLDMTLKELERILYFESYVVIDPGDTPLEYKMILDEDQLTEMREKYGDSFRVGIGAEAIKELLKNLNIEKLVKQLREAMKEETSIQGRKKIIKRLKVAEAFYKSGNKPEWLILEVIPVIPPELRPLVPLNGGRFASSDLNDLYRRVINRNNRLKKLMELNSPEIIIRNEKRMLQEAVDALFDNGRRGRVLRGHNNMPLKSLSDMLKGKQGRFRQNLLGKRVDYSGRSVIVVGPELKMHQCGLPKTMALELFKPFVFHKLDEKGIVTTIKGAKKLLEKGVPEVWDALEEVIQEHPVLLNRAPTLHRLGIQAFQPLLIEGKAIRIHPLVCAAFNADFDGDQMAVHVPLFLEAQLEAKVLMMSTNNLLSPANGNPICIPSQDMVLGCYYLTKEKHKRKGEGRVFSSVEEVELAYDDRQVDLHALIDFKTPEGRVRTTVGRVIFNDCLPKGFSFVNKLITKSVLADIISKSYTDFGWVETVDFLDRVKTLGFHFATKGGISISVNDLHVPSKKAELVNDAQNQVFEIDSQYLSGSITQGERYNKVVDVWSKVTEKVANEMLQELKYCDVEDEIKEEQVQGGFNPIFMMADSGARGSKQQIRQLAGMRGLMAKPSGEIIETPITANFREGLDVLQYFISTHGARKGLADTALKTANAGYLTRRLVDVAQDVVVTEEDCKTPDGIELSAIVEGSEIIVSLEDRIYGRVAKDDICDPFTGELIVAKNQMIDRKIAHAIQEAGIEKVLIRSVLTCESRYGVCRKCYGMDLATGKMVNIGEAVGVIAAQSIGEPGTQLTLRTFHIGGAAGSVAEKTSIKVKTEGTVVYYNLRVIRDRYGDLVVMNRQGGVGIRDTKGREREKYKVSYGAKLKFGDGDEIKSGDTLVEWDPYTSVIMTEVAGKLRYHDIISGITIQEEVDEITNKSQLVVIEPSEEGLQPCVIIEGVGGVIKQRYMLPTGAHLVAQDGSEVMPGDVIAKIPREITKTKDITGGLPRVAELLEARKPKNCAVVTEIAGKVEIGDVVKGHRKIYVRGDGEEVREYLVPKGRHLCVRDGDNIKEGEPLVDGPIDPHDILKILGKKELQKYLVNEVQEVYRLQGVHISDKHIEVIVSKMLGKVEITEVGDTEFIYGEYVDKHVFKEENEKVAARGGKPAEGRPVLQGITKASLSTESFISAASFQETTRVLTEASIRGATDSLRGLKENIVVGGIIPAGTGVPEYRRTRLVTMVKEEDSLKASQVEEKDEGVQEDVSRESTLEEKEVVVS